MPDQPAITPTIQKLEAQILEFDSEVTSIVQPPSEDARRIVAAALAKALARRPATQ